MLAGLLLAELLGANVAGAAPKPARAAEARFMLEVSGDYYPTHASRQIHTAFLNAAWGAEVVRSLHFYAMAGLTFTVADGNITQ